MVSLSSFKILLLNPYLLWGVIYRKMHGFLMFKDEILRHRTRDSWGNILVLDQQNQRILSFDSIYEQSRMDLSHPNELIHHYTRAMLLGLTFGNPAHVTLLGLGGGCLLRAAYQVSPHLKIQAVELRSAVVDIAREYFGLPDSPNLSIEVANGRDYVRQQPDACTDLIWADMYQELRADPFQMKTGFFHESRRILSDNGWLVINCHEMPAVNGSFFRNLKAYFTEILVCTVPSGNVVIYAGKSQMSKPKDLIALEVEIMELKIHTQLRFLLPCIQPIS